MKGPKALGYFEYLRSTLVASNAYTITPNSNKLNGTTVHAHGEFGNLLATQYPISYPPAQMPHNATANTVAYMKCLKNIEYISSPCC
tara:strand:- start:178 stop:438 length:261 start_codon:yes stop_codon:yes gene_type:complete